MADPDALACRARHLRPLWVLTERTPYQEALQRAVEDLLDVPIGAVADSERQSQPWVSTSADELRFVRSGPDHIGLARFVSWLRSYRPNPMVISGWAMPSSRVAIAYALVTRTPYLIHSDTWSARSKPGTLRSVLRKAILGVVLRRAAGLLVFGRPQTRHMIALGAPVDRIHQVPMAVDDTRITTVAARSRLDRRASRKALGFDDRPVVVFVGRLVPEKGLGTLVEALGILDGAVQCMVVGDGPLASSMRSAEVRGLLTMLGRLEGDELWRVLPLGDVFVLPSAYEPWGLVVFEAISAGLPVLTSDAVGCAEEITLPAGMTFPEGNADALAELIRTVCSDQQRLDTALALETRAARVDGLDAVAGRFATALRSTARPYPATHGLAGSRH